ncbi:MAG: hypothetical protein HYU41_00430 [Candidatus Rokubacteria bacterium]|nr:hypothetical protein [Candidatus Rokubacteria bacterium]
MIRPASLRPEHWKSVVALLGVTLVLVGGFLMIHCGGHDGAMDPDLCAITAVSLAIVLLVGPLLSGRLGAEVAPALVLLTLVPLDLPPKFSRS